MQLFCLLFLAALCFGQRTEINLWSTDQKAGSLAPWIFYSGDKFTAEARYNWDAQGIAAGCIGKNVGSKALELTPEICGYSGKYSGFGPELWIESDTKRNFSSGYIQYARMNGTASYGYLWFQSEFKVAKRLDLGLGTQVLKSGKEAFLGDLGLSARVKMGSHWYVNVIPLWRVTPEGRGSFTSFLGLGITF